jgi:hypothetical protein
VPTLVVPIENTLHADMEVRFKALTDSEAIVNFLDKSRSTFFRTHTTSAAPAPSLAPATVAFAATTKAVVDILHSDAADPNILFYLAGKDDAQLAAAAPNILPFVLGRRDALVRLLADAETDGGFHASEKTKAFWTLKKVATEAFLEVYEDAGKERAALSPEGGSRREDYLAQAKKAWEVDLKESILILSKEIIGPFVLGMLASQYRF